MNKSRRFGWLGRDKSFNRREVAKNSRKAARLAAAAGDASGAHAVERLEERQLLFTVTIGPADINPATGLGTKTVDFAYAVPYLAIVSPINPGMTTPITENFDDEMQGWTRFNPPVPPSGTQFDNSRIQLSYQATGTAPVQLIARPGGNGGQPDLALRVALQGTDTMTYTFFNPGGMDNLTRLVSDATFTFSQNTTLPRDGNDLNTDALTGTKLELLNNGAVVQTLSGAALEALRQGLVGNQSQFRIVFAPGFDSVRFSSAAAAPNNSTYSDTFVIESINATIPARTYDQFLDARTKNVRATFSGPVGATVQFLDLYGRDMVLLRNGRLDQMNMIDPIDRNGDGIPDFNDGIGRILINGTNAQSSLTMIGYTYDPQQMPPEKFPAGPGDTNSVMMGIPFGFETYINNNQRIVDGGPPVGVSLVVGAPWLRDNSSQSGYLTDPVTLDFNRPDQGVFVQNGATMGNINIMGAVFGSSHVEGAIARFSVGFLAGSLRVDGDLGTLTNQTDMGGWWVLDPGSPNFQSFVPSQARITVGRTVRSIDVAGRNLASISVLGDVNNPNRARLQEREYTSREKVYGLPSPPYMPVDTIYATQNADALWNTTGQAIGFGAGWYRNDSITSAEFVGYNGTSVHISGQLNGIDPVNTAFDSADVYGFPADASREVVVDTSNIRGARSFFSIFQTFLYVRIVDKDGRVLAALDDGSSGRGPNNSNVSATIPTVLRFRPDHADTYYLVVNSSPNQTTAPTSYDVTLSGMAPVTFGALRVASGAEFANGSYAVTLAAGDMGSARFGTGYFGSNGGESDTTDAVLYDRTRFDFRRFLSWAGATLSAPGNLYNITTGAGWDTLSSTPGRFVPRPQVLVRGNLGTIVTGLFNKSVNNGDIYQADIRAGGYIGLMDVKGGLGIDQAHPSDAADGRLGTVSITTGTVAGLRGDFGQLLVGAYVSGLNLTIRTPAGSVFDQFLVGTNNEGNGSQFPGSIVDGTPSITVGDGSDVRFFDFRTITNTSTTDAVITIGFNQTINFVDDAGASVSISISGGNVPAFGAPDPRTNSRVQIRVLPINGSRGVAIARIDADLEGGANLVITGLTQGLVTIGRIIVSNATAGDPNGNTPNTPAPFPSIIINGTSTEIDVGKIDVLAGGLDTISNTTPRGDIVAIDAVALRALTVSGDLGRTQTVASNTALRGPFLGVAGTQSAVPGGAIFLNPNGLNFAGNQAQADNWQTSAPSYMPVTNPGIPGPGLKTYLEDLGSPVDGYLDGVIVRTGDIDSVRAGGNVGDVLVPGGHILSVVANADGLTPQGDFQGIVGNIYGVAIGTVDVGDGLRGTGPGPFALASIVSNTGILSVVAGGGRIQGSVIQGLIAAAATATLTRIGTTTTTPINLGTPLNGIGTVTVTNGRFDTAFIYSGALDDFWHSSRIGFDYQFLQGDIQLVSGVNSDLFRTQVWAVNIAAVNISGAAFDASLVDVSNNIGTVTADVFRNSTRLGATDEFYQNEIFTTNNLGSVTTNGLAGDMSDLTIAVGGRLTGEAAARVIERTNFRVSNLANSIRATSDIRSVTVQAGRLANFAAGASIRSTSLRISGPVQSVTAADEITQLEVNSSGPDGRVDLVRAQNLLQADITSSGNIGTIQSVTSDVSGNIATRNDVRINNGGLANLQAGRDLLVSLSILGDTGTITAARNIGLPGQLNPDLDLRGNLGSLTVTGGQIYSDLLVGQSITGTVTTGRVSMKPGNDQVADSMILVFGRINALVFNSDFDGDIISRSGGIGSITFNSSSFRPSHSITANGGGLDTLTLNGGDLLGNVSVDGNIGSINVLVGPDGFKGQIGIASWRRNSKPIPTDPLRNELPPGVARSPSVDGVVIRAGGSIDRVFVERGSMTESQIIAGTTIGTVDIALQLRNDALSTGTGTNNAIAAGDRIDNVHVGGFVGAVAIVAGLVDLGADGRVGGTGADADTVKSGSIGTVSFTGPRVVNSSITAGVEPSDTNGSYAANTATFAAGRSSIGSITANTVVGVVARSAGSLGTTSPGIVRGGTLAPSESGTLALDATPGEIQLAGGVPFSFQLPGGLKGTATFSGPGKVWYDASLGRFRLANTTTASTFSIAPNGNYLDDLLVLGNANTALGSLSVGGTLRGSSSVFINGDVNTMTFGSIDAIGGLFGAGGNINTLSMGSLWGGTLRGRAVGSAMFNGDIGRPGIDRDAFVDFLSVNTINITSVVAGAVSSDRGIPTITAGSINNGGIRSGASIGTITVGSILDGRISARTSIGSVVINGNANGAQIFGGGDLGHDADFGGTDRDADVVQAGSVNSVTVNGNFQRSDIAAGAIPGPTGYLGMSDVQTAAGRASIGTVTITGNQTGSNLNSEQYRVVSTGTIGAVTVGGSAFTGFANFQVEKIAAVAVPVRVTDLFVTEASRIFTANLVFNQSIDFSTVANALSVFEIRGGGASQIGLALGTDYTLQYDAARNTVKVVFNRTVTERALPQQPGVPGPGVYQFVLNAGILRGSTQQSILDGNEDGQPGDDFARNAIVGDAGDKTVAGRPAAAPNVSFYGAADLDLVLRRNANIGSLPDVNTNFTLTGSIGDHPNSDPDLFRLGGDVDVYRITLRAGQILRMGAITGNALGAARGLYDSSGALIPGNPGQAAVRLPSNTTLDANVTPEAQYLISQTGTFYIVVGGSLTGVDITDPNNINNIDPVPGAFGLYSFTVQVFDDGNTGFIGDTNSGTAAPLVNPPVPLTFAGVDGRFGTADDLKTFTVGDWVFTLTPGPNGPNAAGAVVTGHNSEGWTVTRTAAPNGTFGSANDKISTTVNSSIGLPGATGVPNEISPDVDVYALNNGQPIAPGTKIRATLRLTKTGSNIGLSPEIANPAVPGGIGVGQNLLGQAQFALFEIPAGTGFGNGKLVAAPSNFLPIGAQSTQTFTDGRNTYGYDANGDFYMEFIVPGAQGVAQGVPASYALYVQGAIRSDYTLEIVQQGTGSTTAKSQNVLLETNGGLINWLEAGKGLTTQLSAFSAGILGFTGQINSQDINDYVLTNLVTKLNALFASAGVAVNFSTNPADFARQNHSTVFLAGNVEPSAFIGNGTFGASQKVDFFNVDPNDQAVVFVSSLAELGFEPSNAGVDQFVTALTAAVGRRVGELLGLRFETSVTSGATPVPVMAADSVTQFADVGFVNQTRPLAGLADNATDTVFYLGTQNSASLIKRVVLNNA